MVYDVFLVDSNIDVEEGFYEMILQSEFKDLAYSTLHPVHFDQVLQALEKREILREDFKVTPTSIIYTNDLTKRSDEIVSEEGKISFIGNNLESPLVYILYRLGPLFFAPQRTKT